MSSEKSALDSKDLHCFCRSLYKMQPIFAETVIIAAEHHLQKYPRFPKG
jgi:hypothetical protein